MASSDTDDDVIISSAFNCLQQCIRRIGWMLESIREIQGHTNPNNRPQLGDRARNCRRTETVFI